MFAERSAAYEDNEKADVLDYYSYSYPGIFEMRKVDWRSEGVILRALQQFRANNPKSQVADRVLIEILANVTDIINSEEVLSFFMSLAQLGSKGILTIP